MFRCPYCNSRMPHPEPEHLPMSQKRREIYDFVVAAGPRGVKKETMIERFFSACTTEVVLRSTIHYINKIIAPQQILTRGGIVRLVINDK